MGGVWGGGEEGRDEISQRHFIGSRQCSLRAWKMSAFLGEPFKGHVSLSISTARGLSIKWFPWNK